MADRPDSTAQSQAFAKALQDANVDATVVPGERKNHGTINRDLGVEGDKPTKAVFEFLQRHLNSRTLDSFKVKVNKELTPEKDEKLFGKPHRNGSVPVYAKHLATIEDVHGDGYDHSTVVSKSAKTPGPHRFGVQCRQTIIAGDTKDSDLQEGP